MTDLIQMLRDAPVTIDTAPPIEMIDDIPVFDLAALAGGHWYV